MRGAASMAPPDALAVRTVENALLYGIILPVGGLVLLAMLAAVVWLLWRIHPLIVVVFVAVHLVWLSLELGGRGGPEPNCPDLLNPAC